MGPSQGLPALGTPPGPSWAIRLHPPECSGYHPPPSREAISFPGAHHRRSLGDNVCWGGREREPLSLPLARSPAFWRQRDSWVTFAPSEARSCFIHIHCCRHNLRVPARRRARQSRYRAALSMNFCQAPKHLGSQEKVLVLVVMTAATATCPVPLLRPATSPFTL